MDSIISQPGRQPEIDLMPEPGHTPTTTIEFPSGPGQLAAKPTRRMQRFFCVLLILLAIAASYAPAVRDGFVWDDTALILRDPLIRSWRLIPEGFNHYL